MFLPSSSSLSKCTSAVSRNARVSRWTLFFLLVAALISQQGASGEEPTTPTILAHPAMFGRRWSGVVPAEVRTVTVDLCNETMEESEGNNIFDPQTDLYGVALFFDPYERTGERKCEYAEMAQVAEKRYPTAQYLLVANSALVSMATTNGYPDTSLAMAIVTFEDGEAIKNRFTGQNTTNLDSGGVLVKIDAVSRSILDVCDCNSNTVELLGNYTTVEVELWITLTRVMSSLSLIGSLYVFFSLVGTKKRRSKHMRSIFNRLLLGICISDIMSSIPMIVATWAVPASPPGDFEGYYSQARWDSLFPGASGNIATCTAQGFFVHLGICGSTFFTGCVAIQTLLVVRYAWTDRQMRNAEIAFYASSIGLPLITGIWAAAANLMNPMVIGFCWLNSSPQECGSQSGGPILDEYCDAAVRGENYFVYQIAFAMAWIFLTVLVIVGSMISLFLFVRKQELQAARWSYNAQEGRQQKQVLTKAMMYISVYALIWLPTITSLVVLEESFDPVAVTTIVATLLPLQGFFNSLIYSGIIEKCLQRVCCGGGTKGPRQGHRNSTATFSSKGEQKHPSELVSGS